MREGAKLKVFAGMGRTSLFVDIEEISLRKKINTKNSIRFGAEVEFVLPYYKLKKFYPSLFINPMYSRYKASTERNIIVNSTVLSVRSVNVNYTLLDLMIGGRYYYKASENIRIYIELGVAVPILIDLDITVTQGSLVEQEEGASKGAFLFGGGIVFKDKVGLSIRNFFTRNFSNRTKRGNIDHKTIDFLISVKLN